MLLITSPVTEFTKRRESTVPVWAFACKNRAGNRMNANKNFPTENLCVKNPPYTAVEKLFVRIVVNEIKTVQ